MKLKDKMQAKYTIIAGYVIVTAIIIYCLSLVANNFPIIFKFVMDKVNWIVKVIKPVILGFIVAYLLTPVVDFIERQYSKLKIFRKKKKGCRGLAVLTTIILIILAFTLIISLLVFSVTDQLKVADFDDIIVVANTYIKNFNDFYNAVLEKLNSLDIESSTLQEYVKSAAAYLINLLQNLAGGVVVSIANISSYITTFLFTLIIGIYFLIDGRMIIRYLDKVFRALANNKVNTKIRKFLQDADMVFSGYIRGQLTDVLVMMGLISFTLSLIGVKFAVVIGIFAGLGNLIPYFGPFIAYVGTGLVCLVNGEYKKLIIGIILLFIVQTIDGNVIGPKLLSNSIDIHPLLVVISLIFGSAIGGLMGMLLAVPIGALLKVLFVRFIDYRLELKEKQKQELETEQKVETD